MKVLSFLKNMFLLSFVAVGPVFSQNYEISIALNTRNDTILMGHFFAKSDKRYVSDTVVLKNGKGMFRSNRDLPNGVYFLYSDGKILFDFIIGDNKKFGIVSDTADLINLTKFTSSPDNDVFFKFQRYNTDRGKQFQQLYEQYKNVTSDTEKNDISVRMQTLQKERIEYIEELVDANNNLYVSKFLRTLLPLNPPDPPKDDEGNITDPMYVYRWWRAHFFDNLNIYDPDMLRTQFYEEKLFDYLNRLIIPLGSTDTLCVEIDKILSKAKANDAVFRYIMGTLYNHYFKLAMEVIIDKGIIPENVWLHLVENWYIPFAHWSSDEIIEERKKDVANRKPNLIGKHAPPIEMLMVLPPEHFKAAAMDTAIKFDLHAGKMIGDFRKELKSTFTVLYFWDYTCGHCKQGIQDLFKVWEEYKDSGLQVLTVQIYLTGERKDKGKWIDFVNEKELFGTGWMNAWSPYRYKYREMYNTANVPVMYLLDEKFDIILRGNLKGSIGSETIKEFFENQINSQQKN